jgi:ketosteroid isomerase-like protein
MVVMAWVNHFINALRELENDRKLDALLACFHPDVRLSNPHVQLGPGHDAPRRFWTAYRETFDQVCSDFHHVTCDESSAMLEWTSRGNTHEGLEFEYRGVSVIEFDQGLITHFRAYFDPSELGHQLEPIIKQREEELAEQAFLQ